MSQVQTQNQTEQLRFHVTYLKVNQDDLKQFGFARHDIIQTREKKLNQIRVYLSSPAKAKQLATEFKKQTYLKIKFSEKTCLQAMG